MDGSKVVALAIAAVALLALIPAFNALNQATVVELKPPIDITDPPENFDPPENMDPPEDLPEGEWEGGTPPPGVACGPATNEKAYSERFMGSTTGSRPAQDTGNIHVNGAVGGMAIIVNWSSYRGSGDVVFTDPDQRVRGEYTAGTSNFVNGKSATEGDVFERPKEGFWSVSVDNNGFSGSFTVEVIVQYPCGNPADASGTPSGGTDS